MITIIYVLLIDKSQYVEQLGHKEASSLNLPLLYSIQYVAYGGLLLLCETVVGLRCLQ